MLRLFGLPAEQRFQHARLLADAGFDTLVVGAAESAESVRPALDAGLRVWACAAAFSVRDLPAGEAEGLLARDPDGQPQRWFNSGCPNQPALRERHRRLIREIAQSGAFAGFMLDGIRFASPNAGEGFFTCFCARCEAKAAEFGMDFAAMRRGAATLRAAAGAASTPVSGGDAVDGVAAIPGAGEWLAFRRRCVLEHVAEVRAAVDEINVRGARFELGAYVFAPALAPLVGQDYAALYRYLDVLCPMLYRTLEGDACLAAEWRALAGLGLAAAPGEFSPADVGLQVAQARERLPDGARLVPILQLADDLVGPTARASLEAGAGGLDFFAYRAGYEGYARTAADAFSARPPPAAPAPESGSPPRS